MEKRILIEIEEPDFMDLVDSDEREDLNNEVVEAIKPRVFDLYAGEMEKLLKEKYNLSAQDTKDLLRREFLELGLL
jgi:hypothetical protein